MRQWSIAAALAIAVSWTGVAPAAQSGGDGRFERVLTVSGPIDLDVSTGSGVITVRSGADGRVQVVGRIFVQDRFFNRRSSDSVVRDIESNPPIEQTGNRIRIGRMDRLASLDGVSISYEIIVPASTTTRSHTGSGSQELTGLQGALDASTGSGRIRITQVRGDVMATTGSGSIAAQGVVGALRAQTGSGSIDAQGTPTGRWDLNTGSGSILVRLPPDAAFDLNAHTGSGAISVSHPLTISGRIQRNDVSGRVRGGGVALDLRTGSGSIQID